MSIFDVVSGQFRLILLQKCNGIHGNKLLDGAGKPELPAGCIVHLFTAIIGYVLIIIFTVGQVPLFYKILRFQTGPSYLNNIVALAVTSSNVVYAVHGNLPVSTWGEGIIFLVLHVIIMDLILLYKGHHRQAVLFMFIYVFLMVILLWPLVPDWALTGLKILSIPIEITRKGYTIYHCYKEKGKTLLLTESAMIVSNFCALGRLLTSLVDTRDGLMIASSLAECMFSIILTFQTVRYWVKKRKNRASPAG